MELIATIECNDKGYFSIFVEEDINGYAPGGYGFSEEEAKADFEECLNEMREMAEQEGKPLPEKISIKYKYELSALFSTYGAINVSQFAKMAGVNPSKMRAYSSGVCKPSAATKKKIENAIHEFGRNLSAVRLFY